MATQQSLSANPATGRQRRRENEIHLSCGCSGSTGGIVCPAHLSLNLDFTQNLRIEAGANPKQVANGGHSLASSNYRAGLHRTVSLVPQPMEPGFPVARARPIQLTPVAGRKKNGGYPVRLEQLQNCGSFRRAERKAFPDLDRRCMVAYTNEMEGKIVGHVQG